MSEDLSLVLRAAFFSGEKHKKQRRRDAEETPYINHPLEVAYILLDEGGVTDAATLAAALLHDTLEDTDTTREELAMVFGHEVSNLVVELTDLESVLPEHKKKRELDRATGNAGSDAPPCGSVGDRIAAVWLQRRLAQLWPMGTGG